MKLYWYVYYNYKPILSLNSSAFQILYIVRPATSYVCMCIIDQHDLLLFDPHEIIVVGKICCHSLFVYASGLRATMRYMGVKSLSRPPATRQSAARAKLSAVFLVPAGASLKVSRRPARPWAMVRPQVVMRTMVKMSPTD